MKRLLTCVALVGALSFGARSVGAQGREGPKGPPATLSAAADKAIKAAFPKATLEEDAVRMAGRGESAHFTAPMMEGDKRFTVAVTESGIILRVTTQIAIPDLTTVPKAVTDAVMAASPEAKIVAASKVEERAEMRPPFTKLEKVRMIYEIRFIPKAGPPPNTMAVAEDGTVIRAPRAPKMAPKAAQPS